MNKAVKRHWLITAFQPFAGRPNNNSQVVLEEISKLAQENSQNPEWEFELHTHTLPVEYDHCYLALMSHVGVLKEKGIQLEGVLSIGEGAEEFKLETQANNLDDVAEFADNRGVTRVNQKIFTDLSAADTIALRFPFEAFSRIRTSKSPGFYICNHLCAKVGREWAPNTQAPYFGFIHVPRSGMGGMFTPDVCAAVIVNGFKKIPNSQSK